MLGATIDSDAQVQPSDKKVTEDGLRLNRAFLQITDPASRDLILRLVEK